jgi:polysaccharide export outer membrane protein
MRNASIQRFVVPSEQGAGHNAASRQPGSRRGRLGLAVSVLALGLLAGCGGPSQQVVTAQALSQAQTSNPNQKLQQQMMQQQLLLQASQASLANYKDYKVGPEDRLSIKIFGQDNLNREPTVNGQGEITMPLVEVVKVAGMTPQEIEKRLEALYDAQFLVNPQITVEVKEYRHQRVAVTGAVEKPGSYEIIGPRTLLEVLSLAGGLSNRTGAACGDVVNVIRHQNAPDLVKLAHAEADRPFAPKTETVVIDLRRLLSGEAPELNLTVHNGDVVHVPFAGTAYVLGGVKKPGNIVVRDKLTVSQAVAMAGGIDPILGTSNITVMRFDKMGKPVRINTNLDSIIAKEDPDLAVKDNDVVLVKESTLKKTIYVIRTLLPIPSGSYSMGTAGF